MNEAHEKLGHIIVVLHEPQKGKRQKPRTYREKARKDYQSIAKQRKAGVKKIRKVVVKQLGYVKRDLAIPEELSTNNSLSLLSRQEYRQFLVISELYRQQEEMYPDEITSIGSSDCEYLPIIVRGKAKANVEFGSKVPISVVDRYALVEKLDGKVQ